MEERHQKRRVRILVKAFPQSSTKHEETVCCAGVADDGAGFLRLYPIRYRRLPKEDQFDRYDLVELTTTKAKNDSRPESYRVDEGSIRIVQRGGISDEARVKLWLPFIAPSIGALLDENASEGRSLGIIKPDPASLRFTIRPAKDSSPNDQEVANLVYSQQSSLLEGPLKPIEKPKYGFYYQFTCSDTSRCTCANRPHNHQIHDWEVQATFARYTRRYHSEAEVLSKMEQAYQDDMPKHNLHFILGTMAAHPRTFIVIGLLRSGLDPDELDRQGALF